MGRLGGLLRPTEPEGVRVRPHTVKIRSRPLVEEAVVLGLLQGIFEWFPVSSQGVTVTVHSLVFDGEIAEGFGYSLWLHVGTVPSVLVVFRKETAQIVSEVLARPTRPSPLARFLLFSTVVSGVVGLPLVLLLADLSEDAGPAAMVVVGVALLLTGAIQIARPRQGARDRDDTDARDALQAGVSQGLAVIPGLSRSGATVAALLWRGVDRREALVLSFLMSVPASIGAAAYVALDGDFAVTIDALVGAAVAFAAGLVSIKLLLAAAARVNMAAFVMIAGTAIVAGAAWQLLA